MAIGKLTIKGRVELAQVLAGFDLSGAAANADAQIGRVSVGGDWIASSIAAGVVAGDDGTFGDGDANEGKMSGAGVKDVATASSSIPLAAGNGNDDVFLGITADFKVNEV